MKKGWQIAALGSVFETITGNTPPKDNSDFYGQFIPFIKPPELRDAKVDFASDSLSESGAKIARMAPKNSILVSCIGNLGKVGQNTVPVAFNQQINAILPDTSKAVPDFMFYQALTSTFKDQLETLASGTTVPIVNKSKFNSIKIILPPLHEQQRIVCILNEIDDLRQKQRRAVGLTQQMTPALFYEMFGDPVTNTMGWDLTTLGDHSSKVGSGATPKGGNNSYKAEGIALIRSLNVRDGEFRWKDLARIDNTQASKLSNVIVEENDVLLNITGASVARVCCAPMNVLPARVNQHVCIIRTTSTVQPRFLERLLLASSMKNKLLGIGESGATRQAITKAGVLALEIPLPPIELQKIFTEKAQQCLSLLEHQEQSLQKLDVLFDTTLNQFFSQSNS